MKIKKIRRICGVKGCKNKHNVYTIARSRELGGVIICEDCLIDAIKAIDELNKSEEVTEAVEAIVAPKKKNPGKK